MGKSLCQRSVKTCSSELSLEIRMEPCWLASSLNESSSSCLSGLAVTRLMLLALAAVPHHRPLLAAGVWPRCGSWLATPPRRCPPTRARTGRGSLTLDWLCRREVFPSVPVHRPSPVRAQQLDSQHSDLCHTNCAIDQTDCACAYWVCSVQSVQFTAYSVHRNCAQWTLNKTGS